MKKKNLVLTMQSTGYFINNCVVHKVNEKNGTGQVEYSIVSVPANTRFKVTRFNLATKRVGMFVDVKGMSTFIAEVDYSVLLNNSVVENEDVFKTVNCMLISEKQYPIIGRELILQIVVFLTFALSMFMLGRIF